MAEALARIRTSYRVKRCEEPVRCDVFTSFKIVIDSAAYQTSKTRPFVRSESPVYSK